MNGNELVIQLSIKNENEVVAYLQPLKKVAKRQYHILSLLFFAYIDSKRIRRDGMNATRQDAWTQDEDIILAETVLRHIREGKTQLEAFKEVAKQLSRTSAACGFRWNATIRKHYQDAIQYAKEERKQGDKKQSRARAEGSNPERDTIETAISLLEKMRTGFLDDLPGNKLEQEKRIERLQQENEQLRQQLLRYDNAWKEMGKLWDWVKTGASN